MAEFVLVLGEEAVEESATDCTAQPGGVRGGMGIAEEGDRALETSGRAGPDPGFADH